MIISHKYKFIFIKTQKTAGTSIEIYLSQQCHDRDITTPINPYVSPHIARNHEGFYNHISACEIRSRIPKAVWKNYFKFCVERNPWDKTLSHYHMLCSQKGGNLSFERYLSEARLCVDHSLYTDEKNAGIIVDRIIRYEKLVLELSEIFALLDIPFEGSLNVYAKSEYRKDRRHYSEVYTEHQRCIVEKAFAWEIQTFGYDF
jgi:hypothetical protein